MSLKASEALVVPAVIARVGSLLLLLPLFIACFLLRLCLLLGVFRWTDPVILVLGGTDTQTEAEKSIEVLLLFVSSI